MLGLSYGQLLLLIGAVVALTGPKDFPRVSRIAGRLAGRAIGYVQLARGQFENVMQQSQAQQVHKELQDTMTQLEAIRHEIRTISFMNPGPLTRRMVDNLDLTSATAENRESEVVNEEKMLRTTTPEDSNSTISSSSIHSKATAYARLAESTALKSGPPSNEDGNELTNDSGLLVVLPVSAESAGLLPNRKDDINGSDLILEAIVESDVAQNAKEFFEQPQNQIKHK